MKLPATLAATALAAQVAGAPPPAVARAYERVAELQPHVLAYQDTKRGRQELLRWQAILAKALTRTQTTVYETILVHYNHERRDAWPGYERIAELAKCSRRTAIRCVLVLEDAGFLTVERRFRVVDRWEGLYRHDRTNVYRFVDGAPVDTAARTSGADDARLDAPIEARTNDRPTEPPAPGPPKSNTAPAPPRPTSDPYWDLFEAAFVLEHRAAYGRDSAPGSVRQEHLRVQASDMLNDLASECVAWARQAEHGVDVKHLLVAEALARRLARAWIRLPGRDNRNRDRAHPIGWMCGDLSRRLCDEAVEGWKRAQRRLLPKEAPAVRPSSTTAPAPDEAAIRAAENTVVMRLVRQGVGFDEALRLARAEGAKVRAALAARPLIPPAAAELHEPLVDPAGRPPPE